MKVAIVGSRTITDSKKVFACLDKYKDKFTLIVSGGARGVDSMARDYAVEHKIKYLELLPNWNKFGKSAGFKRNVQIVDACDCLIAFWDGESRGTKHSIDIARKQGKNVLVFNKQLSKEVK